MNRRRELAVRLRMQLRLERSFAMKYYRLLNRYAKESAKGYKTGGRRGAAKALRQFPRDFRRVLIANVTTSITVFGKHTREALAGGPRKEEDPDFQDFIQAYIKLHGAKKVTQVSETTIALINAVISSGELEGDPIATISRNIVQNVGGVASRHRATTIAITETHSAAAYGSQETAKTTGLDLVKEWVSAEDSRTRETHIRADGQQRPMDGSYDIGGEALQYPGDPSAAPSETVRCRCIEVYKEK